MFVRANAIKVGMILEYEGAPCRVMAMTHITPGKGNAIVQTKLRNLITGLSTENRYRSTEDVKRVVMEQQVMEFIYKDGEDYFFMNVETYEQIPIKDEMLGESIMFLTPNMQVEVQLFNDQIVGIELPKIVELIVDDCPPYVKGATATNQPKPATLETGLILNVPNFIIPGEKIKVDTEEKKYLERAK